MRSDNRVRCPEQELVAAGCISPLRDAGANQVTQLLQNPLRWDVVLSTAEEWQVEPTLLSNLRVHGTELIPAAVLGQMRSRETELRATALARTLTMLDFLRAFEARGIDTIVLKGPAIGVLAYGDPSLRPFGDIDILVKAERLKAAVSLMESQGYRLVPSRGGPTNHVLLTNNGTDVEIHHALFEPRHRLDLSEDELWRDSRRVACLSGVISVLSPWHLFLFLCAHGTKHHWEVFRLILDLAQLSRRLTEAEFGRLTALAKQVHAERILGLGAQLVADCFPDNSGAADPFRHYRDRHSAALAGVATHNLGVAHARNGMRPDRVAASHPYLFWTRSRERAVDQLGSLARFIFQPTGEDAGPSIVAFARRPFRLIYEAGGFVKRARVRRRGEAGPQSRRSQ